MRTIVLSSLILLHCFFIQANDKIRIASYPDWLYTVKPDASRTIDRKAVNNGYYLELFDHQVNLVSHVQYYHFTRHIINESGVQNASEVSVSFSPEYQQVIFHSIEVIRSGATINQLDLKNIKVVQEETDVADYQYNGYKRAFVILKDVRKNDVIEISYSIAGFNPVFSNKYCSDLYFESVNPVCNYFETIISEPSRSLQFTPVNNATMPTEQIVDGRKIYTWSNPSLGQWESHTGSPSWYTTYAIVRISDYKNWSEVVNWGLDLFDHYNKDIPPALEKMISTWKDSAKGNNDELTRRAIRFVQDDIRYLGLEMGEHSHKPHNPAEVFNSAYGDCKDKSLLLAIILQHAGIPAFVAFVNTTRTSQMYRDAASAAVFDHAIVAIGERPEEYRYVDPTINYQRGAYAELFIPAYGYALVVREKETVLRSIPAGMINSTYIVDRLKISYEDSSTLNVYSTYRGGRADQTRSDFSEMSMKEMRKNYNNYYAPIFEGIDMVNDIDYQDDTIANAVTIKESYVIPSVWKKDDKNRLYFDVYAKAIAQELSDPSALSKNQPVALKYPSSVQYTLNIEMPDPWSFPAEELHIKNDSYQFDLETVISGKLITIKYFLTTFRDNIPADEVGQYQKDYQKIKDDLEFRLSYNRSRGESVATIDGLNWPAVWCCFFTLALVSIAFVKLNRLTVDVPYERETGYTIGGWMIVLGITLILAAIISAYHLISGHYFSVNAWNNWKSAGSSVPVIVLSELVSQLLRLCVSLAVFYWFIKKRDIFPVMFLGYVGLILLSEISLWMVYKTLPYPDYLGNLGQQALEELIRSLVYAAIWCTYVIRSARTKVTFLKT